MTRDEVGPELDQRHRAAEAASIARDRYDVTVIGAGIAGLGVAALLASDGHKVLVVERAPFVGGRAVSFVGRGDRVEVDGLSLDPRGFRKALAHARTFVSACSPNLEDIFERGLLDGYTIDAGGHGLFWGDRSRIAHLLGHLGHPVPIPVNQGLAFVDHRADGRMHQVVAGQRYPWMSEPGYASTRAVLRDMASVTPDDLAGLMHTSLADWLADRHLHPEAYDYVKVLAASQTVMADPAMTPAGDFLGYMMAARPVGMNLVSGSVGTVADPGPIALALALAAVVEEHGGRILRSTTARQVLVERGRVTGTEIEVAAGRVEVRCDTVVCTLPPHQLFSVVPADDVPGEVVDGARRRGWGAGLLSAVIGTQRDVWIEHGIDERSFVFIPAILRDGYAGAVDLVLASLGSWAARNPPGCHDVSVSAALTATEMRDHDKVAPVIAWFDHWASSTFERWSDSHSFALWTAAPDAYGAWRPVGEDRLDVRCRWVEGLYLAGDQYGERLWGGGVDGAALSAVLCADAITGGSLEETVFPWYHRGLPAV